MKVSIVRTVTADSHPAGSAVPVARHAGPVCNVAQGTLVFVSRLRGTGLRGGERFVDAGTGTSLR